MPGTPWRKSQRCRYHDLVLIVATDGACPGNPGPGGWAWVTADGCYASGGEPAPSTNNRMELTAVLEALAAHPDIDVTVQTDSKIIVDTFTEWLDSWKRRNMRKANGKPVANAQLILDIERLTRGRVVVWEHVRGHRGHALNERADGLACAAAEHFVGVERNDEFVCQACFLRKQRSQLVLVTAELCVDCA